MRGKDKNIGKVVLAGAGPGDPELITLKTFRYLKKADVIIADRLVSPDLLTEIKEGAEVIFVGKQGGNAESTSQETINQLLVEFALQNKLVLRLKGGDVAFFSNVLDELETLVTHQIPYEIIPGITAASGASAYAGIPLTARGYASSVRLLTFNHPEAAEKTLLKEWAETDDTLVFYMSAQVLTSLLNELIENGISADKWVAVIEQATTPHQCVYSSPIHKFLDRTKKKKFASPTLVIIGRVAQLHNKFNWKINANEETDYFKPIGSHFTEELISHARRN